MMDKPKLYRVALLGLLLSLTVGLVQAAGLVPVLVKDINPGAGGSGLDKLTNVKDAHGKESKHFRETTPRSGKEEKGRGKKGAATQKEGTNKRPSCTGHVLGGRQLSSESASPAEHGRRDFTTSSTCERESCYLHLNNAVDMAATHLVPSRRFAVLRSPRTIRRRL